jgi:hypothetical protein
MAAFEAAAAHFHPARRDRLHNDAFANISVSK